MPHEHGRLASGRQWSVISAPSFDSISSVLPRRDGLFVLLLAADAEGVSDDKLRQASNRLLEAGARYVCAWGPDCLRVHTAFDLGAQELGLNANDAVVMTTWHDREPLKEAIWFAAIAAIPDETYFEANATLIGVAVGSEEWNSEIREYLQAGTPMDDEA